MLNKGGTAGSPSLFKDGEPYFYKGNMKELSRKKYLKEMLEQQMFGRIVLLEKAENGRRRFHIYDENLEKIC